MEDRELLESIKRELATDKTEAEIEAIAELVKAISKAQVDYFFSLSNVKAIMQSGDETRIEALRQETAEKGIDNLIEVYATAEELEAREAEKITAIAKADEQLKEAYIEHLAYLTVNIEDLNGETDPAAVAKWAELYKNSIKKAISGIAKQDQGGSGFSGFELLSGKFTELLKKLQQLEEKIKTTTDPAEADKLQEEVDRIKYDILPTGSPLYLFNAALTYHGKKKQIPTTKNGTKQSDRHKEITYTAAKGGYTITQTDKRTGERVEITLINADKMQGKGVKKCFAFLLTMSNKQNFSPVIGFSLQELVDRGMYSTLENARRGIKAALDTLQNIKFSGTIKKGRRKEIKQAEAGVLFYHYKIKNNYVEVSVNENFNIEFIAAYYALIPQWLYALNNSNAFDLGEYIFMQARQNTAEIKRGNSFNISFKKIRELLALPLEADIAAKGSKWKPKQYVIEPILTAIEDIQQGAAAANNADFTLEAIYNPSYKDLSEFLEGYIKISFNGELYQKLSDIADKQEAKIAQAIAIKEKRLAAPKE